MSLATTPRQPPLRVAFYGRVARDRDDTELSLVRQYEQCRRALPPEAIITTVFYDVGSSPLNRPHPAPGRLTIRAGMDAVRDGGLADLLAEATSADRRFDCLVTCGPDRLSRDSQRAVELMNELKRAAVPYASPEGDAQILTPCLTWPITHTAGIGTWRPADDGDRR
jgi:site-specific DNA recombinase